MAYLMVLVVVNERMLVHNDVESMWKDGIRA